MSRRTRSDLEKGPGRSVTDAIDLSEDEDLNDTSESKITTKKGELSSPEVEKFVETLLRMERKERGSKKNGSEKGKIKREARNAKTGQKASPVKKEPRRKNLQVEDIPEVKEELPSQTSKNTSYGDSFFTAEDMIDSLDSEEIVVLDEKELLPRQLRKRRSSLNALVGNGLKPKIRRREADNASRTAGATPKKQLPTVKNEKAKKPVEAGPRSDEASNSGLRAQENGEIEDKEIPLDVDSSEETDEEESVDKMPRSKRTNGAASGIKVETNPEQLAIDDQSDDQEDNMKPPAIIEIGSDSEEEEEEGRRSVPRTTSNGPSSQIHLFSNFSHELSSQTPNPDINVDTVSVYELIGVQDLDESIQFNFNIDIDYFLTFFHPDFLKKRRQLTVITGTPFLSTHPNRKEVEEKCNIKEVIANLPNRFASHHTKMMINFFVGGAVEIVVMTANLTQLDFNGLTQACWRSGRLYPGKTTGISGKRFRLDLMRYLARYKLEVTNNILKRIDHLDFSGITVELVASAPGTYEIANVSKGDVYGFGKLRQILERNDLLIDENEGTHNVLAQVTSIAYPFKSEKGQTSSVFSHLLCPLFFKSWQGVLPPGANSFESHQEDFDYKPHIVFPTVDDIRHSNFGYLSGSAIHFKYTESAIHRAQYEQNIRAYLRKWNYSETNTGRELLPPHVKYYAVDNGDDWKSLKWVLVGSHNLSKQAWGLPVQRSNGNLYEVGSYELSILIPKGRRQLVPSYKRDTVKDVKKEPVRFPFTLPPTPYGPQDKPWSPSVDCGTKKDRWGNSFKGSFSV